MAKQRIERTCDKDRGITAAEIREGLAETKRRMAQPGYAAAEKRRIEKAERESSARGIKFPHLVKQGTKPAAVKSTISGADEVLFAHIL